MKRSITIAVWLSLAPACVTSQILAEESAGQVGCPPDQIAISDKREGAITMTWKAKCGGKSYFCTFGEPTSCTPEGGAATPSPAAPVAGGCQYDTQCKSDRICEEGRCVAPSTPASASPPGPEPQPKPAPTPAPKQE